VYSWPLVHLAEGMPGIIDFSPFVPLRSKYYLDYKVCVHLWWWVIFLLVILGKLAKRLLHICSSWKYDTLNTSGWNATTVIPCACGLFLYALRNTNKHFWCRCRRTVVVIVSEPNSPVYAYVLSFFSKRKKKLFLLSFLTMKPFHSKKIYIYFCS
jgi:hypothetical protein